MSSPTSNGNANPTRAAAPLTIIFVLGLPGSGKGTLCSRLAAETDWYHVSVGDYLRELSMSEKAVTDAAFGALSLTELRTHLQERKLLPADTVAAVVAHKVDQERSRHHVFLIDGFPRTLESAAAFERVVATPSHVLLLECPKDVAKARFVQRKRGDDDGDIFEKRYEEFQRLNGEIVARYTHKRSSSGGQEETYQKLRKKCNAQL
ncbi:hypothetical protein LTR85_003836 [Meristemomyces frigidus]|nr:hypothetical protein LTR85_003836 [Meristemomyces frigidus]